MPNGKPKVHSLPHASNASEELNDRNAVPRNVRRSIASRCSRCINSSVYADLSKVVARILATHSTSFLSSLVVLGALEVSEAVGAPVKSLKRPALS